MNSKPPTSSVTAEYDVAIIGGGLVGASLACALAPLGLKLCLLEAVTPRASKQPSYDDRTLALSASSCRILEGLDLWPMLKEHATAIRKISVSEMNKPGSVTLDPAELGLDSFGHVVEARTFGAAVLSRLDELKQLSVICPAEVQSLAAGTDEVKIIYTVEGTEQVVGARLVIGADGADSLVRAAMDVPVEHHDYGQTAVICNVSPEQPHRGRAFECFTSTGPFALLPHRDDRCGLVWSVATEQADTLMQLDDESFLQQAELRFGDGLGKWKKIGRRSCYPLKLTRAKRDWRPRMLLLGNAAHAIHPVGAQGFNLGLRDVAVLAELLSEDRARFGQDSDPGSESLLRAYSEWRAPDQEETIAYTDGLARLYANQGLLAASTRHLGLLAHKLVPSMRRQLAIKAMGFRGRIPKLALGERLGGVQ